MYLNMSIHMVKSTCVFCFFFHFFFGVGFESALDPERPFSVLSIPDEVTRHSLLQWGEKQTMLEA